MFALGPGRPPAKGHKPGQWRAGLGASWSRVYQAISTWDKAARLSSDFFVRGGGATKLNVLLARLAALS